MAGAAVTIAANVRACGVGPNATVHTRTVSAYLAGAAERRFGLVFSDPPYDLRADRITADLELLRSHLDDDALIVVERSTRSTGEIWPSEYEVVVDKSYGDTRVEIAPALQLTLQPGQARLHGQIRVPRAHVELRQSSPAVPASADVVIVGADRVVANGDIANKIGTYGLAVLAQAHGIPFYVAAPSSTIDMSLPNGDAIPIEQRDSAEVTQVAGRSIAPAGVQAAHPAFDITPHTLISALITERGVIEPPFEENLRRIL